MLVVQERDQYNIPQVTYTRGQSIDHHLNGAGGIGGLLSRTDMSTGQTAYYHSDAGGNVTMLINAQSAVVASYRYDPFGNLTGISGPLATGNSQRFSSKEWHGPSGLYYYGYRFYEPNLQRWLNRDPIEERGGINLFECVYNSPVSLVDTFGLEVPALDSVDGNPTVAIDICLQEQGLQRTEVNLASKLARAMCRAGRAVKKGNQAHHIVAENDKRAVIARNALKKFGIDINAPENGVGLPARFHQVMHDQEYYDMLKMQANEWTTKEECILVLLR